MGTRTENERVTLRERIFHCLILLQVPNQRRMWREHRRSPSTRVTHRPRCVWRMCRPTGSQSVLQTTHYGLTRSASLTGFIPCSPCPNCRKATETTHGVQTAFHFPRSSEPFKLASVKERALLDNEERKKFKKKVERE